MRTYAHTGHSHRSIVPQHRLDGLRKSCRLNTSSQIDAAKHIIPNKHTHTRMICNPHACARRCVLTLRIRRNAAHVFGEQSVLRPSTNSHLRRALCAHAQLVYLYCCHALCSAIRCSHLITSDMYLGDEALMQVEHLIEHLCD